jgi:hypothetical protein
MYLVKAQILRTIEFSISLTGIFFTGKMRQELIPYDFSLVVVLIRSIICFRL